MPGFDDMKTLLLKRMKSSSGDPLTTDYEGRTITLDQDPYFKDFANLGACLSLPSWRARIKKGLIELEADMVGQISGIWLWSDKKASAIDHFKKKHQALVSKNGPPPANSDFSKLLTNALDNFERTHGFVVPQKLPIFAGFVYGNVFKDTVKNRMHFKDVGAGEKHGEFTHRIQWYAVVKAGALVSVNKENAGMVYGAIHRWLNKSPGGGGKLLQLWNYIFDMQKSLLADGESLDGDDFRSPENLNLWLTGDAEPDFCPLLRSFLRTRRTKRQEYGIESYFTKKLGPVQGPRAFATWQMSVAKKENPSARIVYDAQRVPSYSPKVV